MDGNLCLSIGTQIKKIEIICKTHSYFSVAFRFYCLQHEEMSIKLFTHMLKDTHEDNSKLKDAWKKYKMTEKDKEFISKLINPPDVGTKVAITCSIVLIQLLCLNTYRCS